MQDFALTEVELRDRPWCPWRLPRSAKAKRFVKVVIDEVTARETECSPRQRQRKAKDLKTWREVISRVSLDVVHHHLHTRSGQAEVLDIAIPRKADKLRSRSVYKSPAHSGVLTDALDLMIDVGLIGQVLGGRDHHRVTGVQTVIYAGPQLIKLIGDFGLTFGDIGRDRAEEVIWLRKDKEHNDKHGKRIEYEHDATTRRYRREVRQINSWLAGVDVSFAPQASKFVKHIDLSDRALHRVFNCSRFDRGGRFGGGFWMNMKKELRPSLRIDGEPIVSVDWSSCFLRLAYHLADVSPPAGDLYDIPGIDPAYRPAIKTTANVRLFDRKPRTAQPKKFDDPLPPGFSFVELASRIEAYHAGIKRSFGKGLGFELMWLESEALVAVLLDMKKSGLSGLPLHDCVLTPASKQACVKELMTTVPQEVLKSKLGDERMVDLDVSIEELA